MSITVNDLVVYHYEKQPADFKVGELLHNFNGNDYRVMENYGRGNLLLMQMNTGMFVVGECVEAYEELLGFLRKINQEEGYKKLTETVAYVDSLENTLSSMMKQIADLKEEIKGIQVMSGWSRWRKRCIWLYKDVIR